MGIEGEQKKKKKRRNSNVDRQVSLKVEQWEENYISIHGIDHGRRRDEVEHTSMVIDHHHHRSTRQYTCESRETNGTRWRMQVWFEGYFCTRISRDGLQMTRSSFGTVCSTHASIQ